MFLEKFCYKTQCIQYVVFCINTQEYNKTIIPKLEYI